MVVYLMNTGCAEVGEPSSSQESISAELFSPVSLMSNPMGCEMSLPVLAAQCLRELDNYRRGEPCTDTYGLELVRRATFQDNQEAWAWVQHCFGGMIRGWLRRHPQREVAYRLESEEQYVAQTFERFWQATTSKQRVECSTLAAVFQYLRASLHGAILDMLRVSARPRESLRPVPGESGEPPMEDMALGGEVSEMLKTLLPNAREQRLAYLLYHCVLGSREIVRFCPQEWSDIQEIYQLRSTILERVLWVRTKACSRLDPWSRFLCRPPGKHTYFPGPGDDHLTCALSRTRLSAYSVK